MSSDKIISLLDEIVKELCDPEYSGRKHGQPRNKLGCTGPVCRWAERERGYQRLLAKRSNEGWEAIERDKPKRSLDAVIYQVAINHWKELEK